MTVYAKVASLVSLFVAIGAVPEVDALQTAAVFSIHGDAAVESSGGSKFATSSHCAKLLFRGRMGRFALSSAVVALVFALLMCARKLISRKSGNSRRLAVGGEGPDDQASAGKEEQGEPCLPAEPFPPTHGASPPEASLSMSDISLSDFKTFPEGSLGKALTRLLMLNNNYFQWQDKDPDDANPDAQLSREKFVLHLSQETPLPSGIKYSERYRSVVQQCKEKLLRLMGDSDDAAVVADDVIALFEAEARALKNKHSRRLKDICSAALREITEKTFTQLSIQRSGTNARSWKRAVLELSGRAVKLLRCRLNQYVYIDDEMFHIREELAEAAYAEFRMLGRQFCAEMEMHEGRAMANSLAAYTSDLEGLVNIFESSASSERLGVLQQVGEAMDNLKMLAVELTLPTVLPPRVVESSPIPEGPLGEALSRLWKLKKDFFHWQNKDNSDPNPHVSLPREMFGRDLPIWGGSLLNAYSERYQLMAQECKEKLLKLSSEGGDGTAVADEIIALFGAEAQTLKDEHAKQLKSYYRDAMKMFSHRFQEFKESSLSCISQGHMEAWLECTKPISEKAKGVLESRLYQYLYIDNALFQSRQELADVAHAELQKLAQQMFQDIERSRGYDMAAVFAAYYFYLKDALENFESSASAAQVVASQRVAEVMENMKVLTMEAWNAANL